MYPSFFFLEYLFGIDESTVCGTIQETTLLLQDKFVFIDLRKSRRKKIATLEKLKELFPDLDEILVDATEQPIHRPEQKRKRRKYHSGKKKRFTIKTQIATNRQRLIFNLSKAILGRNHDYKVFQTFPHSLQNYDTNCLHCELSDISEIYGR